MNKEHNSQMTTEARNDCNTVFSAVPFTYEWWIEVGKKAYWKAENLAWHSYYWEVADFCRSRAEQLMNNTND